jgi:hypothetical protein
MEPRYGGEVKGNKLSGGKARDILAFCADIKNPRSGGKTHGKTGKNQGQ